MRIPRWLLRLFWLEDRILAPVRGLSAADHPQNPGRHPGAAL